MERRFEVRREKLLHDAELDRRISAGMLDRLERFVQPFAALLSSPEQQRHVREYVAGLCSDVKRKSAEAIAYLHDQERQGLQKFIGQLPWDERPLIKELAKQVGTELGQPDGVLIFDTSAFKKQGRESVGVARQWCGRLGKVENCQVGVYLGYASREGHTLVDVRLYLPQEWAKDKRRRKKCGVPRTIRFRTRHQLALEMLAEHGGVLPHGWIAGDAEMGRSSAFRRALREIGECYLLAVPSDTLVQQVEAGPPAYCGRGRHPRVPFVRADRWREALPEDAWTRIEVRDGAKGPLIVQGAKTLVRAKSDRRRTGPEETLVVFREERADGTRNYDYYLSSAPPDTPLAELARVAKAEHRIEECLQRAKGEAGMAQYQVRNWIGWHHHQALSLLALWFLMREQRRGKKIHPGPDGPASGHDHRLPVTSGPGLRHSGSHPPQCYPPSPAQRTGVLLPLEIT